MTQHPIRLPFDFPLSDNTKAEIIKVWNTIGLPGVDIEEVNAMRKVCSIEFEGDTNTTVIVRTTHETFALASFLFAAVAFRVAAYAMIDIQRATKAIGEVR